MYFYLKDRKSEKETLILLRYYVNKDKKIFQLSTKKKINPKDWSKETKLPIAKRGGAGMQTRKLTSELSKINDKLESIILKHGKALTIARLKDEFNTKKKDLFYCTDYFDSFIKERIKNNDVSLSRIKRYKTIQNKLVEFEALNKIRYKIIDLDQFFYNDFIIYLRENYNLFDNTMLAYIKVIKTFLHWLEFKGIQVNNDYKNVKISTHETDDVALTTEEIHLIESAVLTESNDKIRDLFLIGVYSGQRWSDYSIFDKSDVRGKFLHKRAKKTKAVSLIPLHDKLKNLLNKYNWNLPKITSQNFNKQIKKICKKLRIDNDVKKTSFQGNKELIEVKEKWELIGTHTARRTFITIASLKSIPDKVIMDITGIKDSKTLQKYKKTNKQATFKLTKDLF
tara:strand:- start:283 stop:1470 length:1188 start_codon:yes stop_codon:yes gene_type:complete